MSFSFRNGTKTTFVEDVVFTFNAAGKIDNVAFGLGKDTENDILKRKVAWKEQTREQLMEFLENYKTAYCLKRLDYIKDIFADDAIIIVGNVTRTYTQQNSRDGGMTMKGKNIISAIFRASLPLILMTETAPSASAVDTAHIASKSSPLDCLRVLLGMRARSSRYWLTS